MEVIVNGEPYSLHRGMTILGLLEEMEYVQKKGIAVAHNQEVVSKEQWAAVSLKEGDVITIITAVAGG